MIGTITKLVLVGIVIWGVFHEHVYETRWTFAPGLDLVSHADALWAQLIAEREYGL